MGGYNMLLDCMLLVGFGVVVGGVLFLLYKSLPPFKKWFDKLRKGEL